MKKKLIVAILSSGIFSSSGFCYGLECCPTFYFGGELQANRYVGRVKNIQDKNGEMTERSGKRPLFSRWGSGAGLFVGTRINNCVGIEAGYSIFRKQKTETTETQTILGAASVTKDSLHAKHRNVYVDVLGYAPILPEVDLIGSIGVGFLRTKITDALERKRVVDNVVADQGSITHHSQKAGIRFGAGAQYKFTENVGTRLIAHYQVGNTFVKNVVSANLGLFFQF